MNTDRRWLSVLASTLEDFFPLDCDGKTDTGVMNIRSAFRQFVDEVNSHIIASEDRRNLMEWRIAAEIMHALLKNSKRKCRRGGVNCLSAFTPEYDVFVWAVYCKNQVIQEAVAMWCNHIGWRYVYVVLQPSDSPRDLSAPGGIHLVGLRQNSFLSSVCSRSAYQAFRVRRGHEKVATKDIPAMLSMN